jgi:hypothetical protein
VTIFGLNLRPPTVSTCKVQDYIVSRPTTTIYILLIQFTFSENFQLSAGRRFGGGRGREGGEEEEEENPETMNR